MSPTLHAIIPSQIGPSPAPVKRQLYSLSPAVPRDERILTAVHPPVNQVIPKLSKPERKARRLRLLQFRYALDQEHERRFRAAMAWIADDMAEFEDRNM